MPLLTKQSLSLVPSTSLVSMQNAFIVKKGSLLSKLSALNTKQQKLSGITTITDVSKGRTNVVSTSMNSQRDRQKRLILPSVTFKETVERIIEVSGHGSVFCSGTSNPPSASQIDQMVDDIDSVYEDTNVSGVLAADLFLESQLQLNSKSISSVRIEIETLRTNIATINEVLDERAKGTVEEPCINSDILGNFPLSQVLSDTIKQYEGFVENAIVVPYNENQRIIQALLSQVVTKGEDAPKFDLVYGPPVSTKGQFVLSEDGLYYDSRSGGLPPDIVQECCNSNLWNLAYAANKGGRGVDFSKIDLDKIKDTAFDIDIDIENAVVKAFYEVDPLLSSYESDKNVHINKVSDQINELLAYSEYDASSAIVINYKESLRAVSQTYDSKINKRKKQVQLAALFGPFSLTDYDNALGAGHVVETTYDISGNVESTKIIPHVPVNDFTYLRGVLNPTLDQQKKLTLFSEDLDDIIKPVQPVYLVLPEPSFTFIKQFSVDRLSVGDWTKIEGASGSASGSSPYVKSLTDDIITDNLLICYNFTNSKVDHVSGNSFNISNAAEGSNALNGRLVGETMADTFPKGLSIPYLTGVERTDYINRVPQFVELPNNWRMGADGVWSLYPGSSRLDDLLVRNEGATFDSWVHVPDFYEDGYKGWLARYRLLLACENSGGDIGDYITAGMNYSLSGNRDDRKVHGMMIGWRFDPGTANFYNKGDLQFVVLPTVSQNPDGGEFGNSVAIAEKRLEGDCSTSEGVVELGMKVSATKQTASGYKMSDVSAGFYHISVNFDYKQDTLSLYLDGELLEASSITTCFNRVAGEKLNTPSPIKIGFNDFRDSFNTHPSNQRGVSIYDPNQLPSVPVTTPWIIGGGFTDNIWDKDHLQDYWNIRPIGPQGFMGTNTNDTYNNRDILEVSGGPSPGGLPDGNNWILGQHYPPISGRGGTSRQTRSGLEGYVGSFKVYTKSLTTSEVLSNYNAQKGFFKNIDIT